MVFSCVDVLLKHHPPKISLRYSASQRNPCGSTLQHRTQSTDCGDPSACGWPPCPHLSLGACPQLGPRHQNWAENVQCAVGICLRKALFLHARTQSTVHHSSHWILRMERNTQRKNAHSVSAEARTHILLCRPVVIVDGQHGYTRVHRHHSHRRCQPHHEPVSPSNAGFARNRWTSNVARHNYFEPQNLGPVAENSTLFCTDPTPRQQTGQQCKIR